jgi:DhnA family fructose-bisphosphate aldolase class Ia
MRENVMSGVDIRSNRLFSKDVRRSFIIAIDHGLPCGVLQGGEHAVELVSKMVALNPDGILISPGLLRRSSEAFGFRGAPSAILRADLWAVDSRVRRERDQHRMLAEPEDAVRLGADAMAMMLVLGVPDEVFADNAAAVARLAERAQRVGVPLIVEVTAWGQHAVNQTDPDLLTFGCRVAAELGADLVKTPFTGDVASMRALVEGCPAPVLVLGGPRKDSDEELLASTRLALQAGARGLIYGRNIWLAPDPVKLSIELRGVLESRFE